MEYAYQDVEEPLVPHNQHIAYNQAPDSALCVF